MAANPNSDSYRVFRAIVARYCEEHGITQVELARRANVPAPNINRILNGKQVPQMDTAEKIAAAIGFELRLIPSEIFSETTG